MFTRKIYFTGSATGNAVASLVVPSRSTLKQIQWAVRFNSITDGAQANLELSYASAREIAVNGAQQCISEIVFESNFVTSGLSQPSAVNLIVPCAFPFSQGQLMYLHALIAGTVVYDLTTQLWFV